MPINPNPQGKGLVPVLQHWEQSRPAGATAKTERTLLNDYAVSALILSARFSFRPVPGNTYYLYWAEGTWRLSLIAPDEWTGSGIGACVGACCLRNDMTWMMAPDAGLENDRGLVAALREFITDFVRALDTQETLEDGLPYYLPHLPFYQRLLATGLASSLSQSARLRGLDNHSARYWLDAAGPGQLQCLPGLK